MRFLFLVLIHVVLSTHIFAQQFEIGKANDHGNVLTADTVLLIKAITRTLNDGTVVSRLRIESKNSYHYLVMEGANKTMKKIAAFTLSYHISKRTYFAEKGLGYFTCTNAACADCSLFTEQGKINGCNCKEKATVSNQCNFTRVEQSLFYMNIIRAKYLMNSKRPAPHTN
ncbi:MAG: hypothetical protein V4658_14400 [Bacteroidota bacterium]